MIKKLTNVGLHIIYVVIMLEKWSEKPKIVIQGVFYGKEWNDCSSKH